MEKEGGKVTKKFGQVYARLDERVKSVMMMRHHRLRSSVWLCRVSSRKNKYCALKIIPAQIAHVHWPIQLWARTGRPLPPIDQNLGLVMAAQNSLRQSRGQIFI